MKHCLVPLAIVLLLPAAPLRADPPAIPGYARMRDLEEHLLATLARVREQEEFEARPYPEKLLIWFGQERDKTPDGKRLTGEYVVRELFRWDRMRDHAAPPELTQNATALLAKVMRERFRDAIPIPKRERAKAALEIADYLNDEYFHIRKAAIDAIAAIYNETKGYTPDMSPRDRRAKEKEIREMIRKLA